jgi:hypothetical protein
LIAKYLLQLLPLNIGWIAMRNKNCEMLFTGFMYRQCWYIRGPGVGQKKSQFKNQSCSNMAPGLSV